MGEAEKQAVHGNKTGAQAWTLDTLSRWARPAPRSQRHTRRRPKHLCGPRLRTYRLPCPIGPNQNCEGAEESNNLLIFILYPKTPHAQNAHLFDLGHVCTTFLISVSGVSLNSRRKLGKRGSGRQERTGKFRTPAAGRELRRREQFRSHAVLFPRRAPAGSGVQTHE